jgi:hypothetical protein
MLLPLSLWEWSCSSLSLHNLEVDGSRPRTPGASRSGWLWKLLASLPLWWCEGKEMTEPVSSSRRGRDGWGCLHMAWGKRASLYHGSPEGEEKAGLASITAMLLTTF